MGNCWKNETTEDCLCNAEYVKLPPTRRDEFKLTDQKHLNPEDLASWDAIVADGENQTTWEQARNALHLTVHQARWVSRCKLLLWHWSQPVAYVSIFLVYFCELEKSQQQLGTIVAVRELFYWVLTMISYGTGCPAFVLLELGSIWQAKKVEINERGNNLVGQHVLTDGRRSGKITGVGAVGTYRVWYNADGWEEEVTEADIVRTAVAWRLDKSELYHWIVYIFAPHYYVTLCLVKRYDRSGPKTTVLACIGVYEFCADCCGVLALYLLLSQDNAPTAMAMGYWLTVCGFVVGTGSGLVSVVEDLLVSDTSDCGIRVCFAIVVIPVVGIPVALGVYVLVIAPLQLSGLVHVSI
eukprot:COSAG02_NODE_12079_length_1601_cov_5.143529_2_plen_353_part_00